MNFNELKTLLESLSLEGSLTKTSTDDGRIQSAESEHLICDLLCNTFQDNENVKVVKAPKPRFWYDIALKINDNFYPINIKITQGQTDNISSKKGMFYALTGLDPETISGLSQWKKYNTVLSENFDANIDTDYYFLVYFKNTQKFLFTSLKRLDTLVPNGNNLPFQCCWNKNIEPTQRTREEQSCYIRNTFIESFKKKTSGLDILLQWEKQFNE